MNRATTTLSLCVAALVSLIAAPVDAAPDLDILASTGLGDELGGRPHALALGPDLSLVLAGVRDDSGTLTRLDRHGAPVGAGVILADAIEDLAVDRRTGRVALVDAGGLQVLDAELAPLWRHALPGRASRVAVGELGTVAALIDGELHSFTADGVALGRVAVGVDAPRDLAIDDAADVIVAVGSNLRDVCDERVELTAVAAFARDGAPRWRAYGDATEAELCGDGRDNLASTRAVAVTRGDDGHMYLLAEVEGRDNLLRSRPGQIDRAADNIGFDAYTDPDSARPALYAYYARFTPGGQHLLGQFFLLPADGSVARPRAISADRHGNVYLAGTASHSLGAADELAVTAQLDAPAAFYQVVEPDLEARREWRQLDADGMTSELSELVVAGDHALALLHAATLPGHADGALPGGPSILMWDAFGPLEADKRPDPETQGTFGYESGVSGSDPTCYCDAGRPIGPAALLSLGVLALACLPRPRRRG
jgi:hypothetical protein